MSDKYQNKYRIPSARAQWWDYGWNGAYFITICTKNRKHFFGYIRNGEMHLSRLGVIADILWHEIPNHATWVELGDFVVMPNHIHGILILDRPDDNGSSMHAHHGLPPVETRHALSLPASPASPASPALPLPHQPIPPTDPGKSRFRNPGKNTVSSILGNYKSAVTKHANRLGLPNGWQSRFYDIIIRDDASYQRISDYIIDNPKNWDKDRFHP